MAQYLIGGANTPPPRGVYLVTLLDVPGVVASNNFFAVMNPKNSGILHQAIQFRCGNYATGSSTTPNSIAGYRTTAQSGGTLYDNTQANRSATAMPDPLSQILTGNPTVVRLNSTPLFFKEPPISTGAGNGGGPAFTSPPNSDSFYQQGEGLVINTAAGNVNQVWNIGYIWAEYLLPVR